MKKIFLLIIIWFQAISVVSQTTYSKEIEEQIKQVENNLGGRIIINGKPGNILERMRESKVKGVSIAVIQNYKMVWTKGYGWADQKEKLPVTEKTLFQVGSISKSINSAGILKLAQDNQLDLSADVSKYLSSWKIPYDSVSAGRKVTTLNLLSHSAGLSNSSPSYFITDSVATLIQDLNGTPPSDAPPVQFIMEPNLVSEYSNPGIAITQLMIQDITKKSYDNYIYETVFKPLGMYSSYYTQESLKEQKTKLATGYDEEGMEVPGKHVFMSNLAAGGLWTTTSDLCKFICELQLAYAGKSNKVLSHEMAAKMLTPYIGRSALGAFVSEIGGIKYFEHGGDIMGFTSQYWSSLEGGNGVVVIANGYHVRPLLNEIINSVATVYKWKDFYKPTYKTEINVPEKVKQKYVGTYFFDSLLVTILKKGDGYYYFSDATQSKMHFASEKEFFNIEFTSEKTFITDPAGNVIGFLRKQPDGSALTTAKKVDNVDTLKMPFSQCGWVGWHYLEDHQYEIAIRYFKRNLALKPDDLNAVVNLAHCYLFKSDYNEALKLYKQYLDSDIKIPYVPDKGELIKQDFEILKGKDFDEKLMAKMLVDLKLR